MPMTWMRSPARSRRWLGWRRASARSMCRQRRRALVPVPVVRPGVALDDRLAVREARRPRRSARPACPRCHRRDRRSRSPPPRGAPRGNRSSAPDGHRLGHLGRDGTDLPQELAGHAEQLLLDGIGVATRSRRGSGRSSFGIWVMTWPTRPPVHDSAAAICQRRFTSARPSRRADATSSLVGRSGGMRQRSVLIGSS